MGLFDTLFGSPKRGVFVLNGFPAPASPEEYGVALVDWSSRGAKGLFEGLLEMPHPETEGNLIHGLCSSRSAAMSEFTALSIGSMMLFTELSNKQIPAEVKSRIASGISAGLRKLTEAQIGARIDDKWREDTWTKALEYFKRLLEGASLTSVELALTSISGDIVEAIWLSGGRGDPDADTAQTDFDASTSVVKAFSADIIRHIRETLSPRYVP